MTGVYYTIGIGYIVYYIANIVYDLFLKKDKQNNENDVEEISLKSLVDEKVKIVGIDDVESASMPSSFQDKNITTKEDDEQEIDIDELRRRFENEENLNEEKKEISKTKKHLSISKIDVMSFLNDAETNVQMIANIDGFKTYEIKKL